MPVTCGGGATRNSQGRLLDSAPDMGALAAVERFLERLFEGQSARIFRTGLRPIQVQRRIERAMETHRVRDGGRTIVPHRLVVRLAADDLTALRAATPGLAASLADSALAYARAHAYTLLERPSVTLRADPSVVGGEIAVDAPAASPAAGVSAGAASGWSGHEPAMGPAAATGRRPVGGDGRAARRNRPPSLRPMRPPSSSCRPRKARGRRSARSGRIARAAPSPSRAVRSRSAGRPTTASSCATAGRLATTPGSTSGVARSS